MLNTMEYDTTFSVVIPLFNKAKNLDRAIASVQSAILNRNIEIIVVDDGSTDPEVSEMLRWYEDLDSRVKVHTLLKNQGLCLATKYGISLA